MKILIAVVAAAVAGFFVFEHFGSHHAKLPVPTGSGSAEGDAAEFVAVAHDALVGHRAPAITLELLDGSRVDLAKDLGHRPIYLKFWATWCKPCREQMPHLTATYLAHRDELAMYAINVGVDDPIENVRAFVAEKKLPMPIAIDRDGSVAEQLHLNVTPQHMLIDRSGVVRYVGHLDTPELERALAAILDPAAPPAVADVLQAPTAMPALVLDDGSKLDLATRPRAPLALTFATLFCDSYIAKSRPEIGATCAAHARALEAVHKAHPEVRWITVAYPVWTNSEDIVAYRKRLGATVPIGVDHGNAWFHKFGVRDTYITVLLDGSGAELGRVAGDGAGLSDLIAKAAS